MPFYHGGRHLWPHFSQSFSVKNGKFLCSSERKFPEVFKTHQAFVYCPLLMPSMAHQTQNCVFFGTPCISFYISYFYSHYEGLDRCEVDQKKNNWNWWTIKSLNTFSRSLTDKDGNSISSELQWQVKSASGRVTSILPGTCSSNNRWQW